MRFEALSLCEDIEDRNGVVNFHGQLGSIYVWQGKFREALKVEREIIAAYSDLGSTPMLAFVNALAGYPYLYLGEYSTAYKQAQLSLTLCQEGKHWFQC